MGQAVHTGVSAAIEVVGLSKRYGGRAVVDDVSFSIQPGEVFTLLGPNGAGKTTTVEMLEGLRRPDEGSVRVLGLDPARDAVALHARVGVMLQDVGAPRALRVREVLGLIGELHGSEASVDEMLDRVGLAGHARSVVRGLSGGELRRLSLAMALIGRPELVFLDEPTSGLDVQARRAAWSTIAALASAGTTVFLTTHLLDEAQSISSRVGILSRGRLIALDTPARLVAGDGTLRVRVAGELDPERLSRVLGCKVTSDGPRWRIEATPTPSLIAALASELAARDLMLVELNAGGDSLEEVFLALSDDRRDPGGTS